MQEEHTRVFVNLVVSCTVPFCVFSSTMHMNLWLTLKGSVQWKNGLGLYCTVRPTYKVTCTRESLVSFSRATYEFSQEYS